MAKSALKLEEIFRKNFAEINCKLEPQGHIPEFIKGRYYLNAPGIFEKRGIPYSHWLDGDGMIQHLHFRSNEITFSNKYLASPKRVSEANKNAPLAKTFGTPIKNGALTEQYSLASPTNVAVFEHAGKLLATGEQTLPIELNPISLQTTGEFLFKGQISGWNPMAAHTRVDPTTQELFCFGVGYQPTRTDLLLYRFDRKQNLIYRSELPLSAPHYVHDFALSQSYALFHLNPYYFKLENFLKTESFMESLSWDSSNYTSLLICDRKTGKSVFSIDTAGKFCIHLVNAFEKNGRLYLDVIEFDRPFYEALNIRSMYTDVPFGRPVRYVLSLEHSKIESMEYLAYECGPDFPNVSPLEIGRPYDKFWAIGISQTGKPGRKFYDELLEFDWRSNRHESYQMPSNTLLSGDPLFIPKTGSPGEGAVICQSVDLKDGSNSFLIFEANQIPNGPIGNLPIPDPIPLGLHATFVSEHS